MQTLREQGRIGISNSVFQAGQSQPGASSNPGNRLKIKEFTSWAVCFAIITVLTGLLKYLKVGITMDSITSVLFYSSLFALAYFIYRIISLSRSPVQAEGNIHHELN
jgi:hypothetical protein